MFCRCQQELIQDNRVRNINSAKSIVGDKTAIEGIRQAAIIECKICRIITDKLNIPSFLDVITSALCETLFIFSTIAVCKLCAVITFGPSFINAARPRRNAFALL